LFIYRKVLWFAITTGSCIIYVLYMHAFEFPKLYWIMEQYIRFTKRF